MLTPKPWRVEPVAMLGLGIITAMSIGFILGHGALRLWPKGVAIDRDLFRFLVSTASFQGAALLLIHQFLTWHQVSWAELLAGPARQVARPVKAGLICAAVVLPITLVLNGASYEALRLVHLEPEKQAVISIVEQNTSLGARIIFGVAAIALAPFVEEILFRGILYPLIKQRTNAAAAAALTAFFFAGIHANLLTFFPLVFLALTLVWIYETTDALLAPIVAHAFFNAVNFTLLINQSEITRLLERAHE